MLRSGFVGDSSQTSFVFSSSEAARFVLHSSVEM